MDDLMSLCNQLNVSVDIVIAIALYDRHCVVDYWKELSEKQIL